MSYDACYNVTSPYTYIQVIQVTPTMWTTTASTATTYYMSTPVAPAVAVWTPPEGTCWKLMPGVTAEQLVSVSSIKLDAAQKIIASNSTFKTQAANAATHAMTVHPSAGSWWCRLEQLQLVIAGEWRELDPVVDGDHIILAEDEVRRDHHVQWEAPYELKGKTVRFAADPAVVGGVFHVRTKTPIRPPEESKDFAQYAQDYYSQRFK